MNNKQTFSINSALSVGWQTYKANFAYLLVTFILYLIISGILSGAQKYLEKQESVLVIIPALISLFASMLMQIGWVRIGIKLLNGEKAEYEDLLRGSDRVVPFFLSSLLVGLIVCAGLVLLIIPGIYWALKYMFVSYLIIDKKMSVGDAMKQSALMTKGVKWQLIKFGFVQLGLVTLGIIALLIGLIAVLPTLWLASLSIYQQLEISLNEQSGIDINEITVQSMIPDQELSANN